MLFYRETVDWDFVFIITFIIIEHYTLLPTTQQTLNQGVITLLDAALLICNVTIHVCVFPFGLFLLAVVTQRY